MTCHAGSKAAPSSWLPACHALGSVAPLTGKTHSLLDWRRRARAGRAGCPQQVASHLLAAQGRRARRLPQAGALGRWRVAYLPRRLTSTLTTLGSASVDVGSPWQVAYLPRRPTSTLTTLGSASVDVSPSCSSSLDAILRSTRRMILPERVLGSPGACGAQGEMRVVQV